MLLFFITYDNYNFLQNYSKFCTTKCKRQRYVYCDYNNTSMTYIISKKPLNNNSLQDFR